MSEWQDAFFAMTMISVVILNCCSAIFQSSLFGMVSNLPVRYMQAVMAGQVRAFVILQSSRMSFCFSSNAVLEANTNWLHVGFEFTPAAMECNL